LRLWSQVFHGNVGIRRALKALSRMRAARVGISTKFPSLLLQCRQFRPLLPKRSCVTLRSKTKLRLPAWSRR
jgi:hypothetical protein